MNDTLTYQDTFCQSFSSEPAFMHFLTNVDDHSFWKRHEAKDLRVVAMQEGEPLTESLKKQYEYLGEIGILSDTLQHTSLLLKVQNDLMPIRSCAIKTILDRARINGYALNRLAKPHLAEVLNYCLGVANGEALLYYSEGKVSAVHAGDACDYSILEIPELFERTIQYLGAHYDGYTFAGGTFDHSSVTALWELTGQDTLIETYKQALARHGLLHGEQAEMQPVVRLTTSNTGVSGANLYPMLFVGSESKSLPLGSPIKEEHKGGATVNKFDENLGKLFSQYDEGLRSLSALLDIELAYPANALQGVMKAVGVPKKLGLEVLELAKAQLGENPCSAHAAYYYLAEVLYEMEREGATGTRIAAMEENLSRALHVNWTAYDMPGDLKW